MACDKLPAEGADGIWQGLRSMDQSWVMLRDPNVPPEAKKAAEDGCKAGVDATKQAWTALGC